MFEKGEDYFYNKGRNIREASGTLVSNTFKNFPTLGKSVEQYFDTNMANIINEWGIITRNDLKSFEMRLSRIDESFDRLHTFKKMSLMRITKIEKGIDEIEGQVEK